MRLTVTGVRGQVGWELARSLLPLGETIALDRPGCDLSRPEALPAIVSNLRPDIIVNAAAYNAVDRAEEEEPVANTINGKAVGALAAAAREAGALLVHYSTDYVFDGTQETPYHEEDAPHPINAYGRSKLAGEGAVRASGCDHLIVRTSWVYAGRGQNFLRTMLRLAGERDELSIVADQIGAPTWARSIADATAHIVRQAAAERANGMFVSGVVHMTASGSTSWHGFAASIIELAAREGCWRPKGRRGFASFGPKTIRGRQRGRRIRGLPASGCGTAFGLALPHWELGLALCLKERAECTMSR